MVIDPTHLQKIMRQIGSFKNQSKWSPKPIFAAWLHLGHHFNHISPPDLQTFRAQTTVTMAKMKDAWYLWVYFLPFRPLDPKTFKHGQSKV